MPTMSPSNRTLAEISKSTQRSFIEANGYTPTVADAIRLTEEAREEIRKEKEGKK